MLSHPHTLSNSRSRHNHTPMGKVSIALATCFVLLLCLTLSFPTALSAAPTAFDCTASNQTQIPESECNALVALFTNTNGTSWTTKTNWLETNTPCNWFGITCINGNVTTIILNNNQLSGTIPSELGLLTKLELLYLFNNSLSGPIPRELGNLGNLGNLQLQNNQFTSSIPDSLGQLTKVQLLNLHANRLTGPIPPAVGNMVSLTSLYFGNNQLSGPIPPQLRQLSQLVNLELSNNQLSGGIPSELGKLSNLGLLYLFNNNLFGPIPSELGNLGNLGNLQLQNNQLTGSIPDSFGQLTKVQLLNLHANQLTGSIPPAIGNMASLTSLYFGNNHLSGPIPPQLGQLTQLVNLELANNQLSGGIPSELGLLTKLGLLHLFNNALTGEVPLGIINVGKDWIVTHGGPMGLDLSYNALSASDPLAKEFLTTNNPAFFTTQTLPPTNLQVSNIQATSVDLAWLPPVYTSDPGGYEVSFTQPDGAPEVRNSTNNKQIVTETVSSLCPGITYSFALRTHTAPHGAQQNDLRSEFTAPVSTPTLPRTSGLLALYILALDSDLDQQYEAILQAIQSATQEDFGKVAIILVDRRGENNTQILHIECGVTEQTQGLPNPTTGQLDTNLHEYNMADSAALGAFIKWARQTYNFASVVSASATPATAQNYPPTMLSYIGHGVAIAPDTDISKYISKIITETIETASLNENNSFLPPTQSKINMTPDQVTDATSKSLISPYALAQALKIGTDNGAQPLILLDIIHCFGGTIEEFYELANPGGNPFAQVMTGSPNYAYAGADMLRQALLDIQPTQDARQMAAKVVQAYDTALNQADQSDNNPNVNHPRIIVAVESSKIPTITLLIDKLATGLLQEFDRDPTTTMDKIKAAQRESVKFDTTTCKLEGRPQDFKLDSEDGLADLADFVTQLKAQFSSVPAVLAAADQIIVQVNVAVITTNRKNGYPWFATDPKPFWEFPDRAMGIGLFTDFNGITLQDKPYVTWQAYWYNRTVSNENPHPYAFVKDGDKNWSDLFARFWEERLGQSGEVGTYACSTTLPEIRFIKNWLYLPLIVR